MKSGKQRRKELKAKRLAKKTATLNARRRAAEMEAEQWPRVNSAALAPDGSYSSPDFSERGYYIDVPFTCNDCGKAEVWTAGQQKWWYEVAKGGVWTTARRCRACRRRERERRNAARQVHLQGLSHKEALKKNRSDRGTFMS
jgi:hypothetical protein